MLGIGVITYKRVSTVKGCIERIRELTKSPYTLVVAEDGGNDGTVDLLKHLDIPVVTGVNRGVCWNKNRALHYLLNLDADPIILIEDDCWPKYFDWDTTWINAAKKHHHVNYSHHAYWSKDWCKGGKGTAEEPWLGWELTGQVTISTRESLKKVGYLDTRFSGYGYGHIEWTERFCKAGYLNRRMLPSLDHGFSLQQVATFRKHADVYKNKHVYHQLAYLPFTYRDPWHSSTEKQVLEEELRKARGQ